MSYQDHLRTCSDCQKRQRPTIRIKAASSYRRERKLSELAALITGASYPGILYAGENKEKAKAKAASSYSSVSWVEKSQKLKELGKLVKG
jgi:hypothetical protein